MRDAQTYEERAVVCLEAVMTDSADHAELNAQLDAMPTDDLDALQIHAQILAVAARREWKNRTTRPSS